MHIDQIVEKAIKQTGLTAFDSNSYRDGLAIVVAELNKLPNLPPEGAAKLEGSAVSFLANRLRIDDYIRKNPDVLKQKITKPLFVFGVPRTGTTLVSNLLDQDPARRTLLNWEAHDSAPPPTTATLRTGERVKTRQSMLDEGARRYPNIGRAHAETADGPTECLSIHKHDFKALWWDAQAPMPMYAEWMLGCDMVSTYQYHKRVLQLLQSQAPGPWSLKMPSHSLHIWSLLQVYPDARLVWTHRDPFKAVGSLCSLIRTVRATNLPVDLAEIGRAYPHQLAEHARRPMAVKDKCGDDRIYDLHYSDLMRDPIPTMRKLYDYLGDTFTPEAEAGMRAWLAKNPQKNHPYTLTEFGLTVDGLRPHFEEYLSRFKVASEATG